MPMFDHLVLYPIALKPQVENDGRAGIQESARILVRTFRGEQIVIDRNDRHGALHDQDGLTYAMQTQHCHNCEADIGAHKDANSG
jgi:hypothetical protein